MALYQDIKQFIREGIAEKRWGPGERLPSEAELVNRMSASRMTVNRALRELVADGVIMRVAGVGSFVSDANLHHPATPIREIRAEVESRGGSYSVKIIELGREVPNSSIADALKLRATTVFHSVMVHHSDGVPVMLEDRWVNPTVVSDYDQIDFTRTTATRHLLAHAPLQDVEQTVMARAAGGAVAEHLQLQPSAPVLVVTRRTWTDSQIASFVHLYYAGDRYVLDQSDRSLEHLLPTLFESGKLS